MLSYALFQSQKGKSFFMTQAAFEKVKSMTFSIISWYNKISIAIKHRFFRESKSSLIFIVQMVTISATGIPINHLICLLYDVGLIPHQRNKGFVQNNFITYREKENITLPKQS